MIEPEETTVKSGEEAKPETALETAMRIASQPLVLNEEVEEKLNEYIQRLRKLERYYGIYIYDLLRVEPYINETNVRPWMNNIPPLVVLYKNIVEVLTIRQAPPHEYLKLFVAVRFHYKTHYDNVFRILRLQRPLKEEELGLPFARYIQLRYNNRQYIQLATANEVAALEYLSKKRRGRRKI